MAESLSMRGAAATTALAMGAHIAPTTALTSIRYTSTGLVATADTLSSHTPELAAPNPLVLQIRVAM